MSIDIKECKNAVYVTEDRKVIDVEINHPAYGWIPYTLNPDDTDQTINNDDLLKLIGRKIAPFVEAVKEVTSEQVVAERDRLLVESDWVVTRASETGNPVPEKWKMYRQALRDVTGQADFPQDVMWPEKPTT